MYTEITLVLVYFLSVIGPENTRHSLNQSAEKNYIQSRLGHPSFTALLIHEVCLSLLFVLIGSL